MNSIVAKASVAGSALLLGAVATLFVATASAQRAELQLPDAMRAPPMRGDAAPTSAADGRVGDPLPDSQLLLPPIAEDEAGDPADLAHDGAVGDLIDNVASIPVARPSQTQIDGKVGDMVRVAPVPVFRPDELLQLASYAPGMARNLSIPPAPAEMSAAEKQCRARLSELGVTFRERPRLAEASGCLVDWPIEVQSLGDGIDMEPSAVLNCQATLALAEYARDIVSPRAEADFGAPLAAINHASAYVCRDRVGTGETKMSEHAFGNAVDIGAFELTGGRRLDVRAYGPSEKAERDFMRAVRGDACGPWKTVLGPGTNADHATHFHLDLAERRRGGTYCK